MPRNKLSGGANKASPMQSLAASSPQPRTEGGEGRQVGEGHAKDPSCETGKMQMMK